MHLFPRVHNIILAKRVPCEKPGQFPQASGAWAFRRRNRAPTQSFLSCTLSPSYHLLCIIIVFELDLFIVPCFRRRLLKQDETLFTASREPSGSLT